MTDLMAWNADATRMPYRMHSSICASCFSITILPKAASWLAGKPVTLTDIRAPVFAVGTERDHIAPWRSTYKINLQIETEVTYLLTSGGHNAGIVSEPGHAGRSFRVGTKRPSDHYLDPERFCGGGAQGWLVVAGMGRLAERPLRRHDDIAGDGRARAGYPPLGDAPGAYVLKE